MVRLKPLLYPNVVQLSKCKHVKFDRILKKKKILGVTISILPYSTKCSAFDMIK